MRRAAAPHDERQFFGQRVDDRNADSVQAAGDLVGVVIELAAGVQFGHHDLRRRALFGRVGVDRNAAPVVFNRDRIVRVNRHFDVFAIAGERLVDGIIDDLEDHVVQARTVGGVADIHARALANRLQPFEDLDLRRVVSARGARRSGFDFFADRSHLRPKRASASRHSGTNRFPIPRRRATACSKRRLSFRAAPYRPERPPKPRSKNCG